MFILSKFIWLWKIAYKEIARNLVKYLLHNLQKNILDRLRDDWLQGF